MTDKHECQPDETMIPPTCLGQTWMCPSCGAVWETRRPPFSASERRRLVAAGISVDEVFGYVQQTSGAR